MLARDGDEAIEEVDVVGEGGFVLPYCYRHLLCQSAEGSFLIRTYPRFKVCRNTAGLLDPLREAPLAMVHNKRVAKRLSQGRHLIRFHLLNDVVVCLFEQR